MSITAGSEPDIAAAPQNTRQPRRPLHLLARALTELLAPTVVLVATYIAITAATAPSVADGLLWGTIAVLLGAVLPFLFILLGVRRGRITDHHIRERRQRHLPLVVALASVVVGLTLLTVLEAPRALITFFALVVAVLIPSIAITVWWQISVHTAIAALSSAMCIALWDAPAAWTVLAVLAVGWSRVQLNVHTVAQVLAGTLLGAGVGSLAWLVLG